MPIIIPEDQSREYCSLLFQKLGAKKEDADIMGDHLTMSEMRGIYSHGLSRIPVYTRKLDGGGFNANAEMKIVKEYPGSFMLDADKAFGPVSGKFVMNRLVEKAKTSGFASAVLTNANHWGFLGYYSMMALEHDMVGFVFCNATGTTSIYGSPHRFVGTSPISVAIPAGKCDPIVFDAASSAVAMGKVNVANLEGRSIPEEWTYDKNGHATTNPADALSGGCMRAFGGYKGSGIAILISVLSAAIAAMPNDFMNNDSNPASGNNVGGIMQVIDISKFRDIDEFKGQVDEFITAAKAQPKGEGVEEIFMPGEIEFNKYRAFKKQGGFEVGPALFQTLKDSADKYGLVYDFSDWER
ncbi:MAG: Ldh family oxidoreductase [Oscillospiraceae bacterium]|nr:Ldh family oxidoreductase [Oscillospiraceae bacterium]